MTGTLFWIMECSRGETFDSSRLGMIYNAAKNVRYVRTDNLQLNDLEYFAQMAIRKS